MRRIGIRSFSDAELYHREVATEKQPAAIRMARSTACVGFGKGCSQAMDLIIFY